MKKIVYTCLFLTSFILFSSSKKSYSPPTLEELKENLLYANTCTWYDAQRDGKPEIIFDREDKKSGEKYQNYPINQCSNSSSLGFKYFEAIGSITQSTNWYEPQTYFSENNFNQSFKDIFGVNPIDKVIPDANGSKEKGFRFFNNKSIETIFNKLYVKPSTKFQSVTYQKVYDISLKEYFADVANVISIILKDKKNFDKIAKEYFKKATKDKDFNGITATDEYRKKHFPNLGFACKNYDNASSVNRLLGIMLRRQTDGTLKIALNSFKNMLKDYDNTTFEKYKNAF